MRDFHHQWLVMDAYANKLTKDLEVPDGDARSRAGAGAGDGAFIAEVTFTQGKGFTSLMTAPFTFVNATTAPLYGVSGIVRQQPDARRPRPDQAGGPVHAARLPGDARVQQPELADPPRRVHPAQRALRDDPRSAAQHPRAAAADGDADDARSRSTCTPRPTSARAATTSYINPVGFGFENYDAAGVFRTTENGVTIDATGTLAGTAAKTAFTDGVSEVGGDRGVARGAALLQRDLDALRVRARRVRRRRRCAIQVLGARLQDDDYKVTDLMVDITRTTAFMFRGAN